MFLNLNGNHRCFQVKSVHLPLTLPKCDKLAALKIAEKLRQAVEGEEIPYQEQQPSGNLTATFGVATYPFDAENVDMLLKRADECLYQGKEAGRNVVIGAEMLQSTAA